MNEKLQNEITKEEVEIITEQEPIKEIVTVQQLENELSNIENSIKSFNQRIKECEENKLELKKKLEIVKESAKKQVKNRLNKELR